MVTVMGAGDVSVTWMTRIAPIRGRQGTVVSSRIHGHGLPASELGGFTACLAVMSRGPDSNVFVQQASAQPLPLPHAPGLTHDSHVVPAFQRLLAVKRTVIRGLGFSQVIHPTCLPHGFSNTDSHKCLLANENCGLRTRFLKTPLRCGRPSSVTEINLTY